jgi:hypothetical protein
VADRKNIFLIGRRRRRGDEDQLTEMLAFLWQEEPETLENWLNALAIPTSVAAADIETQSTLPGGKRPDIAIRENGACILVESKLKSGFGTSQIGDYLDYLEALGGRRSLILLTERPESIPDSYLSRADAAGIHLVSQRWHDMCNYLGEPGEESLAGDFIQLLIREGLVKPKPLDVTDWQAWNGGFNVLLRLSAFLDELDPFVRKLRPGANFRENSGLSKRWIYRTWRADNLELGFGFGAAAGDKQPHTDPIAFAFVGNKEATEEDALRAVGVEKGTRYRWSRNEQLSADCGLMYSWPALARPAQDVLGADSFEEQLAEAVTFLRETAQYFQTRGFLPHDLGLGSPVLRSATAADS